MPKRVHPARQRAEWALYSATAAALHWVPDTVAQPAARALGALAFDVQAKRARWVLCNLRLAFPELSEAERREIGRESYRTFGMNLIDLVRAEHWDRQEVIERCPITGTEHVDRALARGKGALLLTLHIGNWEIGVQAMGIAIEKHRACVIGRPMRNALLYERISRSRTSSGVELLDRDNSVLQLARRLHANRPVAVLNDQYAGRTNSVFAPFFGLRVATAAGVGLLALRTGAAIVPCYSVRVAPGSYRGWFLPEVPVPETGDRKADLLEVTMRCNRVLEDAIRQYPGQWLWGHRRFRHSPDLARDPY
jgi:Kdo2-lipid IVA lauroyltransferase/acyltransferase